VADAAPGCWGPAARARMPRRHAKSTAGSGARPRRPVPAEPGPAIPIPAIPRRSPPGDVPSLAARPLAVSHPCDPSPLAPWRCPIPSGSPA